MLPYFRIWMHKITYEVAIPTKKGGGDEVTVTMHMTTDNRLTHKNEVKYCFKDTDVYNEFAALPEDEQEQILRIFYHSTMKTARRRKSLSTSKSCRQKHRVFKLLF
jgi:hypothetical protein